ncbi:MAG: hypothetical protein ACNS63_04990 [Candidatus Nitrospinota bacterium M3_3B_026]
MSPRWSGRPGAGWLAVAAAVSVLSASCHDRIPGKPEKTTAEYIEAIQKNDFAAVYQLNRVTARQARYLENTDVGDVDEMLRQNYEQRKAEYEAARAVFTPGIQWAEKHFFPASASVSVGEASWIKPVGDDPVNADYEKALTVTVPVSVEYKDKSAAPELEGKKLKSASYTCSLGKIRSEKSVRVYNVDEQWYFNGCILNRESVTLY